MSNTDTILPDSMAIYPHLFAADQTIKKYLEDIRLELLLVYFIDQVDARALPILGKQFDVLGNKGFRLATTEQQKRDILKRAIELHRYKGTIWAVKESLKSVGFRDVEITEHVNGHWARFSLFIQNTQITLAGFADIVAMVEEYKNTRSFLDSINVSLETDDEITLADLDEAFATDQLVAEDTIYLSGAAFYDGAADYDGTIDHSGDADTVTIT